MSTKLVQADTANKGFNAHIQDTYNTITESRPWRHTVGRISCAARIPIYLLAAAFQAVKMLVKTAVTPLTYFLA